MSSQQGALAALAEAEADLGLAAGSVALRDHDSLWAQAYELVAVHLNDAVGDLGALVEHIGSTSVPGLAAKPILDIAIGAPAPIDTSSYIERLEATGFVFQADLGLYGGLFFNASTEPRSIAAHIHVVEIEDFQWRWYLAFRDALRADADLRNEYQALKEQSASEHATDRNQYTQAKFDWVLKTVRSLDESSN